MQSSISFGGNVQVKKIPAPGPGLRWQLANYTRPAFIRSWLAVFLVQPIARAFGVMTAHGTLRAVLVRADGTHINYGVLSYRSITNAFVNFVVDQLQTETSVFGDFKFHDSGVGTTAENVTDTGIETTDGESRVTGTQAETSSPVYSSVGTIAYTTTKAITEHGLFNDVTAGTLMDRSKFTAVNVVSGDSIQFSYSLTVSSGG